MKNITKMLMVGASACLLSSAAYANDDRRDTGEIGYSTGALGYDALIQGDYDKAREQLERTDKAGEHDAARLINLANVYVKLGRYNEARETLTRASEKSRDIDLIMSDGSIMSSREAAKIALSKLQRTTASR